MWLAPVIVTPPAAEVVPLANVKEWLRIDAADTNFDGELKPLAASAVADLERISSTRLITQTVKLQASSFQDLEHFTVGPVRSIEAISYLDPQGAEQPLDPESYELVGAELEHGVCLAVGRSWPTTLARADAVRVTAIVGYGDSSAEIPGPVYFALLKAIKASFDGETPDMSVDLVNHRIWS